MKYDFNQPVDRSGTYAVKYENRKKLFGTEDVIPLWIADMDLPCAQPIVDALAQRVDQKMYGYTARPDSYNEAFCQWQKKRNNIEIQPQQVGYGLGVIPALTTLLLQMTQEGDKIVFFSPVYPEFYRVARDWNRIALTSNLLEQDGYYTIDFNDFEEQLKQGPKVLIMCNPHNPGGRVWTREELTKVGDLCLQYGVEIISDEIHSDLILWEHSFTPFAKLGAPYSDHIVTCLSATKTFNLAGVQACFTVFPNEEQKLEYESLWERLGIHDSNCFSPIVVETAFRQGEEWLKQAIKHFESNMNYVKNYLDEHIPQVKTRLPESTYLMWLDFRELGMTTEELTTFLVEKAGLGLNNGASYGENGAGFMRLNIACPQGVLEQALSQLKQAISTL